MKRVILAFLCMALSFMSGCSKSCQKSNDQTAVLKIGTNANFPPYESIDELGELVGFDIEVGKAIARKLNREVKFIESDFDALILSLNEGKVDLIISGLSITESRQKVIAMVPYQGEPLTEISFLFWQNVASSIASFEDVKQAALQKKLSVSVQAGHFLEEFLRNEGIPIKPLAGPPEQILDIKYNKSLAAAVDSSVGKALTAKHEGLINVILPLPKDKWDLGNGIGIKKSRTDLIRDVTKAIEELKADGSLQTLKNTWLKDGQ